MPNCFIIYDESTGDLTGISAASALTLLGLDADLATLSIPASTTISAFGATLVDDADAATARATLGITEFLPITLYENSFECIDLTGSSKLIPSHMNGLSLVEVLAAVGDQPGTTGTMGIEIYRGRKATIGDATTEFSITNPSGTTMRVTYTGTGTDPAIADSLASLQVGDRIIQQAQNFAAGNRGTFGITAVGAGYYEALNASVAVESNKTIGTGYITAMKWRSMLTTKATIDSQEWDSTTAATPAAINTSYDDVATGDLVAAYINGLHATPAYGCNTVLSFR